MRQQIGCISILEIALPITLIVAFQKICFADSSPQGLLAVSTNNKSKINMIAEDILHIQGANSLKSANI
jgi:hypothetical protein